MRKAKKAAHKQTGSKRRSPPKTTKARMIVGETGPDQHNADVQQSRGSRQEREKAFTLGEAGEDAEQDPTAETSSSRTRRRGALDQEGEGNRQNEEVDELEQETEQK